MQRDDGQINFAYGVKPPLSSDETEAGPTVLEIEMSEGNWVAEWVETKTGRIAGRSNVSGGGIRRLIAPEYENDIALRLIRVL